MSTAIFWVNRFVQVLSAGLFILLGIEVAVTGDVGDGVARFVVIPGALASLAVGVWRFFELPRQPDTNAERGTTGGEG